jgi:hypothetical protein
MEGEKGHPNPFQTTITPEKEGERDRLAGVIRNSHKMVYFNIDLLP